MTRTLIRRATTYVVAGTAGLILVGIGAHAQHHETAPVPTTATLAACQDEDGSTLGQAFPCLWDASQHGNGGGQSFVLSGAVCTPWEIAIADQSHARGQSIRLACDDVESIRTDI